MAHFQRRKNGTSGSEATMKVTMNLNQDKSHPEISIFVAIDTSGSMAGAKINQVQKSLEDIISKAPGYVRFVIRKFDKEVVTLVSKKKRYLEVDRLKNDLKAHGPSTSLYDAWGQVINEIPYDVSKLDSAHILIFTDGCDNSSKNFNLDSIVALVNEKLSNKIKLTFIQAGNYTEAANALESQCTGQFCTVIKVEDSVAGINYGFTKAKQGITFEINLNDTDFLAQIGGLTLSNFKGSGNGTTSGQRALTAGPSRPPKNHNFNFHGFNNTSNQGNGLLPIPFQANHGFQRSGGQIPSLLNPPRPVNSRGPREVFPSRNGASMQSAFGFGPNNNGMFSRTPSPAPKQTTPNYQKSPGAKRGKKSTTVADQLAQSAANMKNKASFTYRIEVGSIPPNVTFKFPQKSLTAILLDFFKQWGDCEVRGVESKSNLATAIIAYDSVVKKNYALQYGGRTYFHGTLLTVREPGSA